MSSQQPNPVARATLLQKAASRWERLKARALPYLRDSILPHVWRRIDRLQQKSPFLLHALTWVIVGAGLLYALYLGVFLIALAGGFGHIPSRSELIEIRNPLASEVYSADGVLLGKYFIENRSEVAFKDISPVLIKALVATEDERFYRHDGVDQVGLLRVAVKSLILRDKRSGGGSTISQQLAKNLFPRRQYRFFSLPVNKLRETIIARRLERSYSKSEVLELYLNTVPFGNNAYGIGTASFRYFGKPVNDLQIEEAAVLVGMLKATSYYNPLRFNERAKTRRNVVLAQMKRNKVITAAQADSLMTLPLKTNPRAQTHNDGLAPYFRAWMRDELKNHLKQFTQPDGSPYNLYTDGLKIYTTIDSRMQTYAEAAVIAHMQTLQRQFANHWNKNKPWGKDQSVVQRAITRSDRYRHMKERGISEQKIQEAFKQKTSMRIFALCEEKSPDGKKSSHYCEVDTFMSPLDSVVHHLSFLNAGLLALDPQSGDIKAWVGGANHRFFKYDHVTSQRQAGSTFKPFVYVTALEHGRDPCEYISNEQRVYEAYDNWSPGNSDGNYGGMYSMQGALTQSVNTVSAELIIQTGPAKVVELAKKMGITSPLPAVPALALGAADVSLLEMVGAYSVFVNQGDRRAPRYLLRITDRSGNVLLDKSRPRPAEPVLSKRAATMMTTMLQSVVQSGTGSRLRYKEYGLKGEMAGKTGTTQDQTDGWFMGFTSHLVAGVWVGGEDRQVRFRSLSLGQGASMALPIWGKFMSSVQHDTAFAYMLKAKFPAPDTSITRVMDCAPMIGDYEEELILTPSEWWQLWWQEFEQRREERRKNRETGAPDTANTRRRRNPPVQNPNRDPF